MDPAVQGARHTSHLTALCHAPPARAARRDSSSRGTPTHTRARTRAHVHACGRHLARHTTQCAPRAAAQQAGSGRRTTHGTQHHATARHTTRHTPTQLPRALAPRGPHKHRHRTHVHSSEECVNEFPNTHQPTAALWAQERGRSLWLLLLLLLPMLHAGGLAVVRRHNPTATQAAKWKERHHLGQHVPAPPSGPCP
jgi:hypothetical protein